MNHAGLDPDLAAALEILQELGPLQVLDVHPTPPRRPAPVPAPTGTGPEQTGLFDHTPAPSTTDPHGHVPPRRRRRVLHRAGAALSPTPSTWRNSL